MEEKDTLTNTEAAAVLGVSAARMAKLKDRDKISHTVRPDGSIRFDPDVIKAYKEWREKNPRPAGRPRKQQLQTA